MLQSKFSSDDQRSTCFSEVFSSSLCVEDLFRAVGIIVRLLHQPCRRYLGKKNDIQYLDAIVSGWWLQIFFNQFPPIIGDMIQFDSYFSNGLVQPPTSYYFWNTTGRFQVTANKHDMYTFFQRVEALKKWVFSLFLLFVQTSKSTNINYNPNREK